MVDMNTLRAVKNYGSMYAQILFVPGYAHKLSRIPAGNQWASEYKAACKAVSVANIPFLFCLGQTLLMSWALRRVAPDTRSFNLLKTGRSLSAIGAGYFAIFVAARLLQAYAQVNASSSTTSSTRRR